MRITRKILLLFIPTFVLSVVTVSLFATQAVQGVLVKNVVETGRSVSLNLAQSPDVVASFETGDEHTLLSLLQQIDANMGSEYVMVLDREGRVVAHTNVTETGKLYSDRFTTKAIKADGPLNERARRDGHPIVDLSFPVWEVRRQTGADEEYLFLGDREDRARRRLGTIRLALPLGPALDTADQISNQVLWIVTLVNLMAMGISLFYVRRILRPVHLMATATERLGQGELGETVPVLSNDEMGRLAISFNRMSRDLAATTVSKDFLDSILTGMRDLLVVVEADGTIRMLNRSVCELSGYSESDLRGQPISNLFEHAEDLLQSEGGIRESTLRSRTDERIPVLMSVAGLEDGSDGEEGYVCGECSRSQRARAR